MSKDMQRYYKSRRQNTMRMTIFKSKLIILRIDKNLYKWDVLDIAAGV